METGYLSSLNPDGGQVTRTSELTFVRLNPGMNPDGRHIPLGMSASVRVTSPNYYYGDHRSFTSVGRNSDGKIMSAGTPKVKSCGHPEMKIVTATMKISRPRFPDRLRRRAPSPCPPGRPQARAGGLSGPRTTPRIFRFRSCASARPRRPQKGPWFGCQPLSTAESALPKPATIAKARQAEGPRSWSGRRSTGSA